MIAKTQKHQYQAYVAATHTVGKTQQIIMLYDGVIRLVQQAKEAITEKRIEDRYNLLVKASSIIHGLQGCLDFESGQEIANVLYRFYSSVDSKLFSVHRDNSIETCDDIINDLKQMREAWVSIDEGADKETPPAQAPLPAEVPAEAGKTAPTADTASIILSA
jgi:flagellar protein FliS